LNEKYVDLHTNIRQSDVIDSIFHSRLFRSKFELLILVQLQLPVVHADHHLCEI